MTNKIETAFKLINSQPTLANTVDEGVEIGFYQGVAWFITTFNDISWSDGDDKAVEFMALVLEEMQEVGSVGWEFCVKCGKTFGFDDGTDARGIVCQDCE